MLQTEFVAEPPTYSRVSAHVDIFDTLRSQLKPDQVLTYGNKKQSLAYEKAVFIGNLNYRFTTPAVIILARSIDDVRATVAFANKNRVRLTVKNGGHSYMGYCLNLGGIVLDMSGLKTCTFDYNAMTVEMDGGLVWKDVYDAVEDKRNIVIGGQCPWVGVSGFTLGAGLSPFSRSYGLGCDNVLAMDVVTYKGDLVHLTPDDEDPHKRDLFWAVRGGGGGNFGVTVRIKSKMHKLRDDKGKVVCGQLIWNLPEQKQEFDDMMETFNNTHHPDELTIDALWSHKGAKQLTGGMTVLFNGNMDKANQVLSELLKFKPSQNTLKEMQWTEWVHESEGWDLKGKVYHHHASFIFAEGAITREVNEIIANSVKEAMHVVGVTDSKAKNVPKCHFLWDHIGGQTERAAAPGDTAFPWRSGHYVATIKLQWTDPARKKKVMAFVKKTREQLLPFSIENKAAYINYIDGSVPNWEEAYYGSNYPRLQQIKAHWDPQNSFRFWQSIRPPVKPGKKLPMHNIVTGGDDQSGDDTPDDGLVDRMEEWWEDYAPLCTPDQIGEPACREAVYERDAEIREKVLDARGMKPSFI